MLKVGDQVVLIGEAFDDAITNDYFVVGGILKSVDVAIDKSGLFMREVDFRVLSVWCWRTYDCYKKSTTSKSVEMYKKELVGFVEKVTEQKLDIETWKEINPSLNSTIEQSESSTFIIYFIIYIALALLLVNSSLMSVSRKDSRVRCY